ncbi:hypothetical protein CAL18_17160 [Bordetella genomosp. 7]|jgi:DNA-binding transcriptional LysR family regulator|uniref:HTH lysR-type domain-containing protein n=1 Tax=Bordetella genomosp. 7 TaxID=1416805 RepID=A0A261QUQ0_9BORD|nr:MULTISPECIES: LysR family transcriptional regulator [Bordetella]OZI15707.1 hypothetical protein CAL18_17160 [Bordetella genomosp. 7]OZI16454.1 hypothetical protein CAL19_17400 [Bordetella genomosp. 7]
MSSIRFFRTFVAVARSGSFSAASERVALTPTAVSLQMRALETDLGQELFDRTGKIVALNERGHRLLPKAEALLSQYDEMRNDDEGHHEVVGAISVGAVATSMALLARTVLALRVSHPKLRVHLENNYSGDLSMRVKEGKLDAVLAVKNSHRIPAGTTWTPLYSEPLVFVANRRAAQGRSVKDLLQKRLFLQPALSTHTGALVERFMRRQRLQVRDTLEMNSLRTIVELAEQDIGVTIVPMPRNASWESDERLSVRRFDDPRAQRAMGLFESEKRSHLTSVVRRSLLDELAGSATP